MTTLRRDGRRPDELRALSITYGELKRVDGSGRFGFGDTQALASVSGPIEVRLAAELASRATFEVSVRPLSNVPATQSKFLAHSLRTTLSTSLLPNQNPRTLIQLVVQSLMPSRKRNGTNFSEMAALVNASSLALINAGSVPMKGVVCAVAIGRLVMISPQKSSTTTNLIVDPSEEELSIVKGGGCFAFLFMADSPRSSSTTLGCESVWSSWQATTPFEENELIRARNLAKLSAERVWKSFKARLGGDEGGITLKLGSPLQPEVEESDSEMEI